MTSNYWTPADAKSLGHMNDPHTGKRVELFAQPLDRNIPYRKRNNTFGNLATEQSDADWPGDDLFSLYTSNGRCFAERTSSRTGWQSWSEQAYRPLRKTGPVADFFIQLGAGLFNGYPLLDVLNFALRHARGTLHPVE